MKWFSKETFYYVKEEIPQSKMDRYRCLDATTKCILKKANNRILLIMAGLCVAFALLFGKLFYLTIMNYHSRSFKPSVLKTDLDISRQDILDRNGTVIAINLKTTDLSVNPKKIKQPKETAQALIQALPDLSYDDVYKKLTSQSNFKYIKRNLTPVERNAINWIGNPYLQETKVEKRVYPQGHLFSHILGATDIDTNGIAGLEKAYNAPLKENTIQLSLDTSVQDMVRCALQNGIKKYKATGGLGIVMDVNTGEVLASVSLPDYNPNMPAEGDNSVRFNKATLGTYEFGSVFKLFNTAMALENKDIKVTDTFDVSDPIKVGRKLIEDTRGAERVITVPEVLIHSSNIGSVLIAQKSGFQKQKEFLERFGFYEKLPLNLPELGITQYPTAEKWADITSANVAFGYGISITPLHLVAGVSALVNGGDYRVPTFLKNGNQGKPVYRVLDPKISEQMRRMMWAVINWDIKESDPIYGYAVGGKTGSANLIVDGKYVQGSLRTSFVGVFPMDNPRYIVLVTLEDPKKTKETWMFNYAGWNAKPVGLEIISKIAPYLGVEPKEPWEQPSYIEKSIQASLEAKKKNR